ncbi:FAD/NAD(P)-binding domain-containing protein [Pilaira anomala]|nr:FAD/NAD(P)-binding domain-containing protein [Pilaira anomala]
MLNQQSTKHYIQTKTRTLARSQGRVVILGSGWAGFKLMKDLDKKNYDVSVISPRNYFVFTPLLASTSVGTLEFRCITEPVRTYSKDINFYQASCDRIDLENQVIHCVSNIDDNQKPFSLDYDKLVISVGSYSNTFGIPGVKEYACFLKDVNDARKIRKRLIECFEHASQPGLSEKEKEELLHFVIVGGGPTGIEFSAELYDFIADDLSRLYPELMNKTRMTLYDVAPTILSSFDSYLSDYAHKKFNRKGIQIKTQRYVEKVADNHLIIKGEGKVPYGLLVWSTGLMQNPLVESLSTAAKDASGQRILTDGQLRVLDKETKLPYTNIYALGDCATIEGNDLPATAQVATQKANYLRKVFNGIAKKGYGVPVDEFEFKNRGMMAYIGSSEALVDMSSVHELAKKSGHLSWLLWRSAYFSMSMNIRNRMLIPYHWFLTWSLGRDISRF